MSPRYRFLLPRRLNSIIEKEERFKASKFTNNTAWTGSITQTTSSKKYTFSTKEKYLTKDIKLTVNVNIVLTASSVPLIKQTFIIYNSGDGEYYLWR